MRSKEEILRTYMLFGHYVYISICVINVLSYLSILLLLLEIAISAILP